LVPEDGLCCIAPPLPLRFAADELFKLLAEADLLPPRDFLGCKLLGVVHGDSLGVEPPDKLSALFRRGLLAVVAVEGLVSGFGSEDGRSTALPGRLALPSPGSVGSFLPELGFESDVFGLETSRLAACSLSEAHLSFSSSSFFRLLSSKAALRSSFFLRLSSACFSRSSLTFSCL